MRVHYTIAVVYGLFSVALLGATESAVADLENVVFPLSVARHVNVPSDGGASAKMATATGLLQAVDASTCNPGDAKTCITIEQEGATSTFGTLTDGLSFVETAEEQDAVFAYSYYAIKIVDGIDYCGGPSLGARGCTQGVGIRNMIITDNAPADTYAHEFGHAQGNNHNTGTSCTVYIMKSGGVNRSVVTAVESAKFSTKNPYFLIGAPCFQGSVDVWNSYFVPQSGSLSNPSEGATALMSFRRCPNNDGPQNLPNNARLKVVLRDGSDPSP